MISVVLDTYYRLRTAGSSDDEEVALHGDGAAAIGHGGSGKRLEAEDLHEGLDAVAAAQGLAPSEGGAVDSHHGGSDAVAGGGSEPAQRQKWGGGAGAGGSRKREAERPPQLSEHGDFAKHAAKLPPEVGFPEPTLNPLNPERVSVTL